MTKTKTKNTQPMLYFLKYIAFPPKFSTKVFHQIYSTKKIHQNFPPKTFHPTLPTRITTNLHHSLLCLISFKFNEHLIRAIPKRLAQKLGNN